MNEMDLTQMDRERIKVDIWLTFIFGLFLVAAFFLLIAIVPLVAYFFGKEPSDGFVSRGLFILGCSTLIYVLIMWKNIAKYADLLVGKKLHFRTSDFAIRKTKDGLVMETGVPLKLKLDLYEDILPLINLTDPITIEVAKLSRTLLFISHDADNSMDKIQKEND